MKLKKIKSTKTRDIYDVPTSYHDYLLIRYEDEINNDIIDNVFKTPHSYFCNR